jgi:outer membrane protein W
MTYKMNLFAFGLVFGFAATAFAQEAAPAEAAPAVPAEAVQPAPASGSSATVNTEPGRFVVGLRLGYGLPIGSIAKDLKMSDEVSGQIPIWLDLGYMVTPNIMVGLYGQYGFGSVGGDIKTLCDAAGDSVSCKMSDIRFGVQGQYHVFPRENLDPWFGLGVGYELMKISLSGGGEEGSATVKGFEFVNLQAGFDYKVAPILGIGPFISFSLGQYGSASADGAGVSVSGDITNKAMHEWLTIGVRGAFTL